MNDKYGAMKHRNTHQSLHVNSSSSFPKAFLVFCHPIISIVSKEKSKEKPNLGRQLEQKHKSKEPEFPRLLSDYVTWPRITFVTKLRWRTTSVKRFRRFRDIFSPFGTKLEPFCYATSSQMLETFN